jgi:signal transduction histidine kinase
MRTMDVAPAGAVNGVKRGVMLGIADPALARRMATELVRYTNGLTISTARDLGELRATSTRFAPKATFLEIEILGDAPLVETVRQIAAISPVILLASSEKQAEAARLVASGEADFLVRYGDFVPLGVALIERRLRWAEVSEFTLGPEWHQCSEDIGEVFRHEINNPLTGILGNAELLLAHRDRLPAVDSQRLQTVVDLAVRLRETVRRVSNAWDPQPRTLKSA